MRLVKQNDKVRVYLTGKLEDETVFYRTRGEKPAKILIGNGDVVPGLEKEIIGMKPGEQKKVVLPPEEAFGKWQKGLLDVVKKAAFPDHINPTLGKTLKVKEPDGSVGTLKIVEMDEETVTLDANHPLAGKTVIYDVKVIDIE
jgi:FKBP-type peptidyl-prolyl cis-trans isomerase SlpA